MAFNTQKQQTRRHKERGKISRLSVAGVAGAYHFLQSLS